MAIDHGNTGLASSLTDLMTSLAVIFILLLVASLNNTQQTVLQTKEDVLKGLREVLKEFKAQGIEVKNDIKDPLVLLVVVPADLLNFAHNDYRIPEKGKEFLKNFIPKLAIACSKQFKDKINSMVVEGHTSSVGTDEYNLSLSQSRSMEVVKESLQVLSYYQAANRAVLDLRSDFLLLLSASGRGKAEPIPTSSGEENEASSRRVVFKIRIRSLEQTIRELFNNPGQTDSSTIR